MDVRFTRVVRPATELQIRNGRFSTISEGHDMVELEQATLATPAARPDRMPKFLTNDFDSVQEFSRVIQLRSAPELLIRCSLPARRPLALANLDPRA